MVLNVELIVIGCASYNTSLSIGPPHIVVYLISGWGMCESSNWREGSDWKGISVYRSEE